MKRNWNTIEIVLTHVEIGDLQSYAIQRRYLQSKITEEEFIGHVEILQDAGIIRNCFVSRDARGDFSTFDFHGAFIAMAGHDLLDALRDSSVWGRIKEKAGLANVSISWEFVKAAIPAVMKELAA